MLQIQGQHYLLWWCFATICIYNGSTPYANSDFCSVYVHHRNLWKIISEKWNDVLSRILKNNFFYFFNLQWPIIYKIYGDKHRHLAAAVLPLQVRPIMSRQVPVAVHPTSILYSTLLPYWLQMQQQHYRWHCLPQDLLHRKQPQGRGYIHQDQHRMTYTMARMGLTHHLVLSIR